MTEFTSEPRRGRDHRSVSPEQGQAMERVRSVWEGDCRSHMASGANGRDERRTAQPRGEEAGQGRLGRGRGAPGSGHPGAEARRGEPPAEGGRAANCGVCPEGRSYLLRAAELKVLDLGSQLHIYLFQPQQLPI